MGNYSWLLKIINGDSTIIDWKSILPTEHTLNDNYLDIYEEDCINISSITDLANYLDDRKLFGYLTNSTKKTLCKICLYTKFIDKNINITDYPKLYFEEEGWDRIHFLEFYPGTETINWGSYAFDFNEKELEKSLIDQYNLIYNIELTYDHPDSQMQIYDKLDKRRIEYLQNLICDKLTIWNIKKLDYLTIENQDNNKLLNYLTLFGIRYEDYLKNPIETLKIMKDKLEE